MPAIYCISAGYFGGGRGIRTPGTLRVQWFSRPPPSTTRPSLRKSDYRSKSCRLRLSAGPRIERRVAVDSSDAYFTAADRRSLRDRKAQRACGLARRGDGSSAGNSRIRQMARPVFQDLKDGDDWEDLRLFAVQSRPSLGAKSVARSAFCATKGAAIRFPS